MGDITPERELIGDWRSPAAQVVLPQHLGHLLKHDPQSATSCTFSNASMYSSTMPSTTSRVRRTLVANPMT